MNMFDTIKKMSIYDLCRVYGMSEKAIRSRFYRYSKGKFLDARIGEGMLEFANFCHEHGIPTEDKYKFERIVELLISEYQFTIEKPDFSKPSKNICRTMEESRRSAYYNMYWILSGQG